MEEFPSGKIILIAEDDVVSRKLLVTFLTMKGYRTLTAVSGCEAVDVYQKQPVDLILMDVRMPEMDGFTAVEMIREHERKAELKRVPIIAVTACAIAGDRQKCLAVGMDEYLTKPVELDLLRAALEKWL